MDHSADRDTLNPSRKEIIRALAMVARKLHSHDQAALFDASFALTLGELRALLPAVIDVLGGDLE